MRRNIYSIYRARNIINNKNYIGEDAAWPSRPEDHKRDAFNYNSMLLFHKAIRKYSWEAFEWTLLYQSYDGKHTLNVMEPFFIKEYDSFGPNGYNLTAGGEGTLGYTFTQDQRHKLSLSQKGKKNSIEAIEKRKVTLKRRYDNGELSGPNKGKRASVESRAKRSQASRGENNPNYGKKASEITREKMRQAQLGKVISEATRRKMSETQRLRWERRLRLA